MGTPNYLGFLQATPKGSPLQAGLEAAFQGYGDVQDLIQKTEKTKVYPALLQSEMQKNSLTGMPPLDQAAMLYLNSSQRLGEDHPTTSTFKQNYLAMLKHQQTLTDYQSVLAGAKDFSVLPEAWRNAVLQSGGASPSLGQGIPLGGGQAPSTAAINDQTSTNQGQVVGDVNGLPMTKKELDKYNQISSGQGGQSVQGIQGGQQNISPNNLQGAHAIFQKEYSPEAKISQETQKAQQVEQSKTNIKGMNELLLGKEGNGGYMGAAISASNTLNSLNQFKKAYDESLAKGAIGGLIFGKLDPSAQVAIKNGSQLIMNNMQALKGVTNRWNISEFKTLAAGNPDVKLDPKAVQEIYSEMSTALHVLHVQGALAYSASKLTSNPVDIQKLIGYAMEKYNPVDENGNIQLSYLDKMSRLVNPTAMNAITNGKDYDPIIGEYSEEDLKHTAKKRNISVDEVKRKLGIR
ncbi:MAG: hypothetical protein WC495_03760 [Patescibacteria group bacterium]